MVKACCLFERTTTSPSDVESFTRDAHEQVQMTNTALLKQLVRRAQQSDTPIDIDEWVSGDEEGAKIFKALLASVPK